MTPIEPLDDDQVETTTFGRPRTIKPSPIRPTGEPVRVTIRRWRRSAGWLVVRVGAWLGGLQRYQVDSSHLSTEVVAREEER